jgi:hypothetical protein
MFVPPGTVIRFNLRETEIRENKQRYSTETATRSGINGETLET